MGKNKKFKKCKYISMSDTMKDYENDPLRRYQPCREEWEKLGWYPDEEVDLDEDYDGYKWIFYRDYENQDNVFDELVIRLFPNENNDYIEYHKIVENSKSIKKDILYTRQLELTPEEEKLIKKEMYSITNILSLKD